VNYISFTLLNVYARFLLFYTTSHFRSSNRWLYVTEDDIKGLPCFQVWYSASLVAEYTISCSLEDYPVVGTKFLILKLLCYIDC
jgi:hypothetical protein